jgi:hypothetical protein
MKNAVSKIVLALIDSGARRATMYLDEDAVATAVRIEKPRKRARYIEIRLKLGKPNFRERLFIKACKKAGEPFPIKKIQLKFWPK